LEQEEILGRIHERMNYKKCRNFGKTILKTSETWNQHMGEGEERVT